MKRLLKINHSGYLYDEQKIEIFIDSFRKLVDNHHKNFELEICFTGVEYNPKSVKRLKDLMRGYEKYLTTTPRLGFQECLDMEKSSDLLLMAAYGKMKGIPSSKLYQYIGHRKPIVLCPSDHDIIHKTLEETGLGLIADDSNTAYVLLDQCLSQLATDGYIHIDPNEEAITRYSRRIQTGRMANILNSI